MTRRRPETFLRMSWWPLRQSPGVGDCQDAATSHHQDPTQPHPHLTQFIAKDTREKCVLNRILLLPLYHISLIPKDNLGQLSLFYESNNVYVFYFCLFYCPPAPLASPLTPTAGYRKLIHWNITNICFLKWPVVWPHYLFIWSYHWGL